MNSTPASDDFDIEQSPPSSRFNAEEEGNRLDEQLSEGDLLRIELYEEVPRLDREIIIKEKVQIKKVLTEESIDSQPE